MPKSKTVSIAERYTALKKRVLLMEADLAAAEAKAYLEADAKNPDKSETWKKHYAREKVAPLMNRLAQEKGLLEEARVALLLTGEVKECV